MMFPLNSVNPLTVQTTKLTIQIRKGVRRFIGALFLLMAVTLGAHAENSAPEVSNTNLYNTPFTYTWNHPNDLYADNGSIVNGAAITGGYITGIPGMIIGVPIGIVGAFFGQVTEHEMDKGFKYSVNTTSNIFCRIGQHVLGLPVLGLKALFYDLPKKAFSAD